MHDTASALQYVIIQGSYIQVLAKLQDFPGQLNAIFQGISKCKHLAKNFYDTIS